MMQEGVTRRQIIAAGLAAAAAGLAAPGAATADSAEAMAQGTVIDGADKRGLPGVMVSNGRDVVLTDAAGRWSLPVAEGESLFVIKPSGWMTPVEPGSMLPRYAYVHAPEGSPAGLNFRFRGLDPTGKLPASIDFVLHRQEEASRFQAILFTDPQPESLAEVGYIRDDVVAQVDASAAAFGITHGDIMFDDLSFYERCNHITGSIGLPWYYVPGNHDMNLEAPDDIHSRETFKRVFGARYSAFQYGRATFLLLDNVQYLGTDPSKPNGFGKYRGFFGERQLQFVRNVLAHVPADQLVVISFHIPLHTIAASDAANNAVDAAAFLAAISSHANTISFCGHTHTNEHHYFGAADGYTAGEHHHHVLAAVSGSWWSGPFDERGIPVALQSDGCPNGFHILTVDGNKPSVRFVPSHDPQRSQIRLMLDSQLHRNNKEVLKDYHPGALLRGPVAVEALPSTRLLANVFDGGPKTVVEVSLGHGMPFHPMTRVARLDPHTEEVFARASDTKKPWVEAGVSSHLWQIALPAGLGRGTHRVTVRARDEFGAAHEAAMVLEVTA